MKNKNSSEDIIAKEAEDLKGELIKEIFKKAGEIAKLHAVLTSKRGNYFRMNLLHKFRVKLSITEIKKLRREVGLSESQRHLNKLLEFKLIEQIKSMRYMRTALGEKAINALRELERGIGKDDSKQIYDASLGINSIMLFLRVYGQEKEFSVVKEGLWKGKRKLEVRYKPVEIGRITLFLPRTIEGISAIDKLNLAGLLVYEDDGYVHMPSIKARSFYQYLKRLYDIILE